MTRRLRILAAIIVLTTIALAEGGPAASLSPSALAADPPPANDNFDSRGWAEEDAQTGWTVVQSTSGATLEPGESAPCAAITATVWIEFAPVHGGTVEITTLGSSFDTVLAVYTTGDSWYPSPPGGNLNAIACNDDAEGTSSDVTIAVERRARYYVQIGGKGGATGELRIEARCVSACRPINDDFRDARGEYVGAEAPHLTLTTTTGNATLEAGEPRPCGNIGATVWYQVSLQSPSTITVDTAGSDFDTVLAVYRPPFDIYPSPPGTLDPSDCNDDAIGRQSRLTIHAEAWSPFWIQVGGANDTTGSLVLGLACDPACAPANDDITSALGVGIPWGHTINSDAATTESGEPSPCGNVGRTVWYLIQAPSTLNLVVDTAGSDFDTVVAVYTTAAYPFFTPARNIGCAVGAVGSGARLRFATDGSEPYLVQIGGRNGVSGELNVSIDCASASCPPSNDAMQNLGLVYSGLNERVDTVGATVDPGEALNCGITGATVWYHLPASGPGRVRVSATESDYPVAIAAYRWTTISPPGALTLDSCGDPAQPAVIELGPEATFGDYLIQVGSTNGNGGTLRIRADCIADCPEFVSEPITDGPGAGSRAIAGPDTGSGGYLPGAR